MSNFYDIKPKRTIENWVDGGIIKSKSDRFEIVTDSATGKECASVLMSSKEDVLVAIESSKKAFESWSKTPVLKRARVMFKFKELIERDKKKIAAIITQEHGKVLDDAEGSIQRGLEVV